jgi:hypothetical protein
MPNITGFALVAAVQTVDEKVWALKAQIDQAGEDEDVSDLEDEMMGFIKAGESLRGSYEQACQDGLKLPPYEKLVR